MKTLRTSAVGPRLFCLLFFIVLAPLAHAQFAQLTLQSQPGDFIGQGGTFSILYTPSNSNIFSAQVRRTIGTPALPAELLFIFSMPGNPDNYALLFFGTDQLGIPMQPGVYTDAQRADFAAPGHPGLDVSFQHRGSNTLTGMFTVNEVTFGANNAIQSFSASFEQHSEGAAAALYGNFIYRATGIPEPSSLCLFGLAGLPLLYSARAALRRRQS